MSGMDPNIRPNSGGSAGPGTITNANAVPLQAIDPTDSYFDADPATKCS